MNHHEHNEDCADRGTICPYCGCCEHCENCGCQGTIDCPRVGCICSELSP